jgi:hypothetical protein
MIAICRDHAANVKRWQDGQMVLRWVAARDGRGGQAVPPGQRLPAPAGTPRRARPDHRCCRIHQGGCRLIKHWTAAEVPRRAGQPLPLSKT